MITRAPETAVRHHPFLRPDLNGTKVTDLWVPRTSRSGANNRLGPQSRLLHDKGCRTQKDRDYVITPGIEFDRLGSKGD
jgi:hypothetical protein